MYIKRLCPVKETLKSKSILFLGPRRTGKTHYIKNELKPDRVYNLLLSKDFTRLASNPGLIIEEMKHNDRLVVIDEIQKLPSLLDEIHHLIETTKVKFLITGSSARKLRRTYTSLMAGRARIVSLLPFTYLELKKAGVFDLNRVLNYGSVPAIYLSEDPELELEDYCGIYIKEEIQAEAVVRKIENFSRFIKVAALSNTELINFTQISQDSQVPQRTIVEYFNILKDTLIGDMVEPFKSEKDRKTYSMAKFYFFDIGVSNYLASVGRIERGNYYYGKAFEHFIYNEIKAYRVYNNKKEEIQFWRDYNGNEIDFIIGGRIAIESKAVDMVNQKHLKGIKAFSNHNKLERKIIVSLDERERKINDVEIMPVYDFLDNLWSNKIW
jgi:predicted AAA+ superfamily ATPase